MKTKIKRFISGMILFLAVAVILIFGNSTAVNLTISAVAIIAINEYFNSLSKKYKVERWIGNILAILLAFINVLPKEMLILMFPIGIALLFFKVIITEMKTNFVDIAITGFGIIYIIGFIMFIPLIYMSEHGKLLIWYLAISAWGTDTFAYLVGIKFGKHKLTPISPKKSIEGSIGGIVGSTLIAIIYTYFINKICNAGISYLAITGIGVALSVLAQIGDLAASSIKRYVDIKDFGKIIPGHGGMLDRIDSILFIAPFAYFLLTMI
jgi:phosphatidate cytidylyltransferase